MFIGPTQSHQQQEFIFTFHLNRVFIKAVQNLTVWWQTQFNHETEDVVNNENHCQILVHIHIRHSLLFLKSLKGGVAQWYMVRSAKHWDRRNSKVPIEPMTPCHDTPVLGPY